MTERLTLQQMFDNAVRGLYTQGEMAYDGQKQCCVYRLKTRDGKVLRCGLGQSIPDDLYSDTMEGRGPIALRHDFPTIKALFHYDDEALIQLQACHDNNLQGPSFLEGFLGAAWGFAEDYHLTWPEDVPRPD